MKNNIIYLSLPLHLVLFIDVDLVTSHLATRKTRHQQTRHQYKISYYIKSKPNMIFSEA